MLFPVTIYATAVDRLKPTSQATMRCCSPWAAQGPQRGLAWRQLQFHTGVCKLQYRCSHTSACVSPKPIYGITWHSRAFFQLDFCCSPVQSEQPAGPLLLLFTAYASACLSSQEVHFSARQRPALSSHNAAAPSPDFPFAQTQNKYTQLHPLPRYSLHPLLQYTPYISVQAAVVGVPSC